ncbi:hypothetical protein PISMIDRAFT_14355 [Pisolithus microcarpus 441]|uniref:Uncharacterized protein n=1 Tax=Pisolithus microcarpus 441 TaxID=765257 RepID=A0A0C9Z7T3_9AGAM|nr:hypothetical protein PISMIDRAFT_14355 [Pisolithus microcarpus 441]
MKPTHRTHLILSLMNAEAALEKANIRADRHARHVQQRAWVHEHRGSSMEEDVSLSPY